MERVRILEEGKNQQGFEVEFPDHEERLPQDQEWCVVRMGDSEERIRFHDYSRIYSVPGLYEHLFYETLECCSPAVVCSLLEEAVDRYGDLRSVSDLTVLDVGAGNGMVGEELKERGVEQVVGLDLIPEAAVAAERDRSGVYDEYVVEDLTDLSDQTLDQLEDREFNCLTTVAALGFGDIPPEAFAAAFNLIDDDGWAAFNIRDKFMDTNESSGFSRLIERMIHEGVLDQVSMKKYRHRLALNGEPLYYYAFAARKTAEIPARWLSQDADVVAAS